MTTKLKNGDHVLMTWFPDNRGEKNAYIGMSGVVQSFKEKDGSFILYTGNSYLIVPDNKYRFLRIFN
jgi:hypothetical protein